LLSANAKLENQLKAHKEAAGDSEQMHGLLDDKRELERKLKSL